PRAGRIGSTTELGVPTHESRHPLVIVDGAEPRLVDEVADAPPRVLVAEQVVALGHDDARRRLDRDLARDRLVDVALERRREHGVVDLAAHTLEQADEAPAVERLDRALAVAQAEPVEG